MRNRLAFRALLCAHSLALFACSSGDPIAPDQPGGQPPVTPSNRWSDPGTWPDGQVPSAGAAVTIAADRAVLLDVMPPALKSLTIAGTLVFDDRDLELTAGWILVSGTLRVGTAASPFLRRAIITLTGSGDGVDVSGMGNKVLGVAPGGTLDLHGEPRSGWMRLGATASAGSAGLVLERPTEWRAGDRLVVASTDFEPDQAEVVTVTAASGANVTLERPLRYGHFGVLQTIAGRVVDERAEVGLLTRNVVIRGDSVGSINGYGGHIMVMGGTARLDGVELLRMGQKRALARYPMHWHMMGRVDGQYFTRSSVRQSFNRCVTVHGTDGAKVADNVCYDHLGHGYFLEDGAETGNLIANNLGLGTRAPARGEELLPSDARPATFWITNPDNTVRGNAAAGSHGFGFWYALPARPTGLSSGSPRLPRNTALREFGANVAHSNRRPGLQVDDGPRPDGTTETVFYAPRRDPADAATAAVANFSGLVAFKHRHRAVWLRGRDMRLTDAVLADNGIGATFASSETFVEGTLFVGESDNRPTPLSAERRGFEFYDGRVGADRVTFANYTGAGSIPSSALGFLRENGFSVSTANFAGALQFHNANAFYVEPPHADKDGDKAAAFLDRDGAVTGTAGAYVVANTPFLTTDRCALRAEWNAQVCQHRYLGLSVRSDAETVAPLTVTRQDNGAALSLVGVPDNPRSANASVIPGGRYTLQFVGAAPLRPRLFLNRTVAGEGIRITLPYPSASLRVIRDYNGSQPLQAAADIGQLDASPGDRYYYAADTGLLHLKLVTRTGRDAATLFVEPQ